MGCAMALIMKAAMKAKGMKAMKAMKAMKSKKVSVIARGKLARSAVFTGKKAKTVSGLTKDSFTKNKQGKLVSKKASANGKKRYASIKKWAEAVQKARKALGVTGFCAIGGKTAQGKALYAKAKALM